MLDITLTHQEQQQAVEKIHALIQNGMPSGEAIRLVAEELRQQKLAKPKDEH